jgi:hypothetical protein
MPRLVFSVECILYGVSDNLDESGQFQLVPFDNDVFDEDFDNDVVDEAIFKVADAIYGFGNGSWLLPIYSGCILTKNTIGLEVRNIVDMIDTDPDHSRFYIVGNESRTDYRWIVAVSQGMVTVD